jgi:hypothetical protein
MIISCIRGMRTIKNLKKLLIDDAPVFHNGNHGERNCLRHFPVTNSMKLVLFFIFILQISCSAASSFLTGFAGNISSDAVDRAIDRQVNPSDCSK